jgi:hypothetical protein
VKEPDYTLSDLAFYGGLMSGFIITYLTIQSLFSDCSYFARLAIAAAVGLGTGYSSLKFYESKFKPPTKPDGQDNRSFPES